MQTVTPNKPTTPAASTRPAFLSDRASLAGSAPRQAFSPPAPRRGLLALEGGLIHRGWLRGAQVAAEGDLIFTTAATGWGEILSDPSYAGQIVVLTHPMAGNYRIDPGEFESSKVHARALVASRLVTPPEGPGWSLEEVLAEAGIPAITDVDTRALTLQLRRGAARRAVIRRSGAAGEMADHQPDAEAAESVAAVAEALASPTWESVDHVAAVAAREPFELAPDGTRTGRVVLVDYGVKHSLLRALTARGLEVIGLPPDASAQDVAAHEPDLVVLSPGPGDPARMTLQIAMVRDLVNGALSGGAPILGICLGHQLLALAAGAPTRRLAVGHHGGNHAVIEVVSGRVDIGAHNHEVAVVDDPALAAAGFAVSHRDLNDGTVEGLEHASGRIASVQFHPEGAPGPIDAARIFDQALKRARAVAYPMTVRIEAPRRVLVIGSGPILIGQAAEFDYAGVQACLALRGEGVETILVNSNPATVMTDPDVGGTVIIGPLTVEHLTRVIEEHRPDALLPTLGGQTGLNLAVALGEAGVLDRCGVRVLGTPLSAVHAAEDRGAFRSLITSIGEPVPESAVIESVEDGMRFVRALGAAVVVRPAYTLGGGGGGFATSPEEAAERIGIGLETSPIGQVLVERSLLGWKEIEFEVLRDAADTTIAICGMENMDPMGVHTGDSIVVAPIQTLPDPLVQSLRRCALKIVRALQLEGGCNVQLAVSPEHDDYRVIEVNPRVSRSSALASKATGYPIARVAALIALGYRLDELPNPATGIGSAAFEPAVDYVVVKLPRWPFDKFPLADRSLGVQMKATGEAMAIDREFGPALLKAVRSLDPRGRGWLWEDPAWHLADRAPEHLDAFLAASDSRLWRMVALLRRRWADPAALSRATGIAPWFTERLAELVEAERHLVGAPLLDAKRAGFGDAEIAALSGVPTVAIRRARVRAGIAPAYRRVDTCAGEFPAETPYFYSSYTEPEVPPPAERRSAIVVGSGPIRIGQGIEFDYCSVRAAWAIRAIGLDAVVINNNPETVSTDYDACSRLYFEPLDTESVLDVIDHERALTGEPPIVVLTFGGQTAIDLAKDLAYANVPIAGLTAEAIETTEDRERFAQLLERLGLEGPRGLLASDSTGLHQAVRVLGLPVIVRPSWVIGGRGIAVLASDGDIAAYLDTEIGWPLRVDAMVEGVELDVDAICDGDAWCVPGILEQLDVPGVHSGDSEAVLPPQRIGRALQERAAEAAGRIALALGVRGVLNVQMIVSGDRVVVIEANPRASRTVPIVAKATGQDVVAAAVRCALGATLREVGLQPGLAPDGPMVAVKTPVGSLWRLPGVDSSLGPEMRSTGEVLGLSTSYALAVEASRQAAAAHQR